MKYLQVKLDNETHDKFKEKSTINSTDMSSLIRLWINSYLGETHEEQ